MWKTQSKILIDRGVFELEDAPLLLAYCNAFHLMLEAEKMLANAADDPDIQCRGSQRFRSEHRQNRGGCEWYGEFAVVDEG